MWKNAFKTVFMLITKKIITLEVKYLKKLNINVYIREILVLFASLWLLWFPRYEISVYLRIISVSFHLQFSELSRDI